MGTSAPKSPLSHGFSVVMGAEAATTISAVQFGLHTNLESDFRCGVRENDVQSLDEESRDDCAYCSLDYTDSGY